MVYRKALKSTGMGARISEELLVETLSPGWHQITVIASASDDHVATDTIQLLVGYRAYMPVMFRQ